MRVYFCNAAGVYLGFYESSAGLPALDDPTLVSDAAMFTLDEPPIVARDEDAVLNDGVWSVVINSARESLIIDSEKEKVLSSARERLDREMHDLVSKYPPHERDSWPIQLAEAKSYLADNSAATPLVDELVASRGIEKSDFMARIILKSQQYQATAGAAIGRYHSVRDGIEAAMTLSKNDALSALVDLM